MNLESLLVLEFIMNKLWRYIMSLFGNKTKKFAEQKLYFCSNNSCLYPKKIDALIKECQVCDWAVTVEKPCLIVKTKNNKHKCIEQQHHCPKHNLHFVHKCPVCKKIINMKNNGSPINLLSPVSGGKTVYSITLVSEIENSLYKRYGINWRRMNGKEYYDNVVCPLVESGTLPAKTKVGEVLKTIYFFTSQETVITLTDMSGETLQAEDINEQKGVLLLSNEGILLLDPHASPATSEMRAQVVEDKLSVIVQILKTLHKHNCLNTINKIEIEVYIEKLETLLKKHGYPAASNWQNLAKDIVTSLENLKKINCRQIEIEEELAVEIAGLAGDARQRITFDHFFNAIINFMESSEMFPKTNGKFDYKLTVVVNKSDELPTEFIPNWDVVYQTPRYNKSKKHSDLKEDLKKISSICREKLLYLVGEQFIDTVESNFNQVSYFFVSSLGRGIDIIVENVSTTPPITASTPVSGGITRSQDQSIQMQQATLAQQPRPFPWQLKKVVSKSEQGTRTPAPKGVLLPLLWLLTN